MNALDAIEWHLPGLVSPMHTCRHCRRPIEPELRRGFSPTGYRHTTTKSDGVCCYRGSDNLGPQATPETRTAFLWPYNDSARVYHDQAHITEMLFFIDKHLIYTKEVSAREAVAAAVFHDWVYDPTAAKGVNETASAQIADEYLKTLPKEGLERSGWPVMERNAVMQAILVTVTHLGAYNDLQQLIIEADLERFSRTNQPDYDAMIRKEYSHISDRDWHAGREGVLTHYLEVAKTYRIGPTPTTAARPR